MRGFSLVEISIVLVILGLLTGGILAGQSLIRAAELRAVSTEYSRYVTALGSFRDRYFALPGDMKNATSFWLAATACPGTSSTPSTSAATCDGDGNGKVTPNAATSNELFRAWQHLANAGLVEGSYTGVASTTTATSSTASLGVNVPRSKLSNAGWTLYSLASPIVINSTNFFEGDYGAFFFFGGTTGTDVTFDAVLKPEEAWNIDTKLDDGRPGNGLVMTRELQGGTGTTACQDLAASSSVSVANASYSLQNTGANCSFMMKTGF